MRRSMLGAHPRTRSTKRLGGRDPYHRPKRIRCALCGQRRKRCACKQGPRLAFRAVGSWSVSRSHSRSLTLELSGRCGVPQDSTEDRHSGPLERIVRRHMHGSDFIFPCSKNFGQPPCVTNCDEHSPCTCFELSLWTARQSPWHSLELKHLLPLSVVATMQK